MEVVVVVIALVLLDLAALRWGVDSSALGRYHSDERSRRWL